MKIDKILNIFDLRSVEKEVFKACFDANGVGATEIAKRVGVNRTSAYDFLDKLVEVGIVVESQKQGVKMFFVQKPENIINLIEEKQKEINNAKSCAEKLKEEYYLQKNNYKPKFQIYEGQEELRHMMKDFLLYRDIELVGFWPVGDVAKILGEDFYEELHQKRVMRNINIKIIWPENHVKHKKRYNFLRNDKKFLREVKIAPDSINFSLGYAVYENTVRFISSQKENYGFLIESKEMADMMRKQFEISWKCSKMIK